MDRDIDHALTTIACTLDGMEAVIGMVMELDPLNADAIGYLLVRCIALVREQCGTIEERVREMPEE